MNLLHHRLITHKSPPPSLMRKHHKSMITKNKNELNVPQLFKYLKREWMNQLLLSSNIYLSFINFDLIRLCYLIVF